MKTVPDIVVQIVHIEGPLKGEVQEFSDSEIQIGRNSSCHVIFPKDQMTISRLHATIVREGNRFRIIDKSSNGTLVNGKFVTDQYIKDGDVIFITEQGPKISFLTRKPAEGEIVQKKAPEPKVAVSPVPLEKPPAGKKEMPVRETSVTLVIQYGTNLHSFKKLPVTVGKSPECNLMIDQPSICGQHAQFFFGENQYWVKDLTGRNTILINDIPVGVQRVLQPEDQLRLSESGPVFRFIGGGRLVEVEIEEPPVPTADGAATPDSPPIEEGPGKKSDASSKIKNMFKSFIKH